MKKKPKYKLKKYNYGSQGIQPDYTEALDKAAESNSRQAVGAGVGATALDTFLPGSGKVATGINTVSKGLTQNEYGNYKSGFSAIADNALNPMAMTNAVMSGDKDKILNAYTKGAYGAITGKGVGKTREAIEAEKTAEGLNLQNKFSAREDEQMGYAKNGLDMTKKYKQKYPGGTKGISTPKVSQSELETLNMLQNTPAYKEAIRGMIGYSPKYRNPVPGSEEYKYEDSTYNAKVQAFNLSDATKRNFDFTPYFDQNADQAKINNMATVDTNRKLSTYLTKRGSDVSNKAGGFADGTEGVLDTKPVEVEKDELIFQKQGGRYKLKADFTGGKTHEQGGEPYIASEGDVIYPGKLRSKVMKAYKRGDNKALETMRMSLPKDTVASEKKDGVPYINPSQYLPKDDDMMLDEKIIDGPQNNIVTGLTPGGMNTMANKPAGMGLGDWGSTAMEAAPTLFNLGKGLFDKPAKTNRRNFTPDKYSYKDMSDPLRKEVNSEYQMNNQRIRNASGGNAGTYLANAAQAGSRKYKQLSEINNAEVRRQETINNANIDLTNQAKQVNLGLGNQYDQMDNANKSKQTEYIGKGIEGLSGLYQNNKRESNMEARDKYTQSLLTSGDYKYDNQGNIIHSASGKVVVPTKEKLKMGTQGIKTKSSKYKMKNC